jgi:maltooligosyltrehalose trehalohydrolase
MKRSEDFSARKLAAEKAEIPINDEVIGAVYLGNHTCRFRVWAPSLERVNLRLLDGERIVALAKGARGYHEATVKNVDDGALYFYQLTRINSDPIRHRIFNRTAFMVPSQVVDGNFRWEEKGWVGIPLKDYIIYELHVGRFPPTGTFRRGHCLCSSISVQLGVTAIELMPVAQFPGSRNWGYDGVFPFAAQNSYGGPRGLKRLINACHRRGLAVILDVVYNHLGPEGNYLADFGPTLPNATRHRGGRRSTSTDRAAMR